MKPLPSIQLPELDLDALLEAVEALPDVEGLNHLHVWTTGERDVHLSAHVTLQPECAQCRGARLIRE